MGQGNKSGQNRGGGIMSRVPLDRNERKKLGMLGGLCVLGIIVLAWTFLGNQTPGTAQAGMVGSEQPVVDLEGALREMQKPVQAGGRKLFTTVDEALDVFLDGWKTHSLSADQVRLNAFDLRGTVLAQVERQEPRVAAAAAAGDRRDSAPGGAAKEDSLILQLRQMRLETVLVSSRNRAAIINGHIVNVGEVVDGFTVSQIEPNRVVMERDGRAFALTLR